MRPKHCPRGEIFLPVSGAVTKAIIVVLQGAGGLIFDLSPGTAAGGQFDGMVWADGEVGDEAVAVGGLCGSVEYIDIHPVDRQRIAAIKQGTPRSQR